MNNILGPRNLRGILGETFKIIGRNFLRLSAMVAIVQVPLWIAIEVITQASSVIGVIGARLLFTVAQAFLWGALIHAVSEQYLRQTVDMGRAFRFAWRKLWPLTGVAILVFLLGFLAAMLLLITPFLMVAGLCVAIYFAVRWACAWQAASLEGLGPIGALSRSSDLVKGNGWRVLGFFLVLFMILVVISGATSMLETSRPLSTIFMAIPIALIAGIGYTVLYYDLRVRKEGYNLESLAEELHIKIDNVGHQKAL